MKTRKKTFYFAVLLLAAAAVVAVLFYSRSPQPNIVSWFIGDVDRDSEDELLVITAARPDLALDTGEAYGDTLAVYSRYQIRRSRPVLQGEPDAVFDLSSIKPLKVMAGDINGDGLAEIGVCVYKTAKFHPVLSKRPFFYDLKDGELESVWLGSRLARPFDDYLLFDLDGDGIDEIVSIESEQNGNKLLALYDWKGFGFEIRAVSDEIQSEVLFLNNTNTRQDGILVNIGNTPYHLRLDGDKLTTAQQGGNVD
ncbi:MAG: hypothetical protein LUH04_15485 [Clostridium sp.]|nr:hypothetical protein [Clostridium sp.]